MSVNNVSALYPFASYAPAATTDPAQRTTPADAPQQQPVPQAAAAVERAEEPTMTSGPGQVVDRKV